MATFFVGQRVRMARPFYPENLGRQGRIRELGIGVQCQDGGYANCAVDWDDGQRDAITVYHESGGRWRRWTHTSQLEPILPDGHRACDEDFKRDLDRLLEGVAA